MRLLTMPPMTGVASGFITSAPVRGALQVNGVALSEGDAALLDKEPRIVLDHGQDAEVLVFDLAP